MMAEKVTVKVIAYLHYQDRETGKNPCETKEVGTPEELDQVTWNFHNQGLYVAYYGIDGVRINSQIVARYLLKHQQNEL